MCNAWYGMITGHKLPDPARRQIGTMQNPIPTDTARGAVGPTGPVRPRGRRATEGLV